MKSIRTKIIKAFLLVVLGAVILITAIIVVNLNLVNRYKQINQNIIYEEQLRDNVSLLVEDIYNAFKSNNYTDYDTRLADIKTEENILDTRFSDPSANGQTKIDYRSVKNALNAVVDLTENAKNNFEKNGTIIGISDIFQKASADFSFVEQDMRDLLFAEAENITNTTASVQTIQNTLTPIVLAILLLSAIFLVIFSIFFTKKITDPLANLASIAKRIIDGDSKLTVQKELLDRTDEIGSLSVSFDAMIKNLREKIIGLELSGKKLLEANNDLTNSKKAITNLLEDVEDEKSKVEETVKERTQELSDEKSRLLASINSLLSAMFWLT